MQKLTLTWSFSAEAEGQEHTQEPEAPSNDTSDQVTLLRRCLSKASAAVISRTQLPLLARCEQLGQLSCMSKCVCGIDAGATLAVDHCVFSAAARPDNFLESLHR